MPHDVTIGSVRYTLEKLPDGSIRVTHPGGQLHPMQGPGTDGIHTFCVHPAQSRWHAYWNAMLPSAEQAAGAEPPLPWWSSKGWKEKGRRSDEAPPPAGRSP